MRLATLASAALRDSYKDDTRSSSMRAFESSSPEAHLFHRRLMKKQVPSDFFGLFRHVCRRRYWHPFKLDRNLRLRQLLGVTNA
jgi:hypothetical protein